MWAKILILIHDLFMTAGKKRVANDVLNEKLFRASLSAAISGIRRAHFIVSLRATGSFTPKPICHLRPAKFSILSMGLMHPARVKHKPIKKWIEKRAYPDFNQELKISEALRDLSQTQFQR